MEVFSYRVRISYARHAFHCDESRAGFPNPTLNSKNPTKGKAPWWCEHTEGFELIRKSSIALALRTTSFLFHP